MLDFYLIHNKNKSLDFKNYFLKSNFLLWETCLRQIVVSSRSFNFSQMKWLSKEIQFFRGQEAYQFLLEVISGFHSPILGETEVLGQFKIWIQENGKSEFDPLWQHLITAAKKIRHTYLNGIRQQSYGSLVRQVAKPYSMIEIIGSGFLVKKILPWFKKNEKIFLFCRNIKKGYELKKHFSDLHIEIKELPYKVQVKDSLLIIAAPVSLKNLQVWLKEKKEGLILDLRSQSDLEKKNLEPFSFVFIETLNEMIKKGDLYRENSKNKINQALRMIREQSNLFFQTEKISPFGWEDLSF